jgi:DNA-binding NarL/FixJ family response regulator
MKNNSKTKVAIIEDHILTMEGYKSILSRDGRIEIKEVGNYGNDLFAILKRNTIDVLLLDVGLKKDAIDNSPFITTKAVKEILKKYPELAIIIITLHSHGTLISLFKKLGVKGYIFKDDQDSYHKLGDIICDVQNGKTYFPELVERKMDEQKNLLKLSKRESEILFIYVNYPDMSSKTLSEKLNIADQTVRNTVSRAYKKLGVSSRIQAIHKLNEIGFFQQEPPINLNFD